MLRYKMGTVLCVGVVRKRYVLFEYARPWLIHAFKNVKGRQGSASAHNDSVEDVLHLGDELPLPAYQPDFSRKPSLPPKPPPAKPTRQMYTPATPAGVDMAESVKSKPVEATLSVAAMRHSEDGYVDERQTSVTTQHVQTLAEPTTEQDTSSTDIIINIGPDRSEVLETTMLKIDKRIPTNEGQAIREHFIQIIHAPSTTESIVAVENTVHTIPFVETDVLEDIRIEPKVISVDQTSQQELTALPVENINSKIEQPVEETVNQSEIKSRSQEIETPDETNVTNTKSLNIVYTPQERITETKSPAKEEIPSISKSSEIKLDQTKPVIPNLRMPDTENTSQEESVDSEGDNADVSDVVSETEEFPAEQQSSWVTLESENLYGEETSAKDEVMVQVKQRNEQVVQEIHEHEKVAQERVIHGKVLQEKAIHEKVMQEKQENEQIVVQDKPGHEKVVQEQLAESSEVIGQITGYTEELKDNKNTCAETLLLTEGGCLEMSDDSLSEDELLLWDKYTSKKASTKSSDQKDDSDTGSSSDSPPVTADKDTVTPDASRFTTPPLTGQQIPPHVSSVQAARAPGRPQSQAEEMAVAGGGRNFVSPPPVDRQVVGKPPQPTPASSVLRPLIQVPQLLHPGQLQEMFVNQLGQIVFMKKEEPVIPMGPYVQQQVMHQPAVVHNPLQQQIFNLPSHTISSHAHNLHSNIPVTYHQLTDQHRQILGNQQVISGPPARHQMVVMGQQQPGIYATQRVSQTAGLSHLMAQQQRPLLASTLQKPPLTRLVVLGGKQDSGIAVEMSSQVPKKPRLEIMADSIASLPTASTSSQQPQQNQQPQQQSGLLQPTTPGGTTYNRQGVRFRMPRVSAQTPHTHSSTVSSTNQQYPGHMVGYRTPAPAPAPAPALAPALVNRTPLQTSVQDRNLHSILISPDPEEIVHVSTDNGATMTVNISNIAMRAGNKEIQKTPTITGPNILQPPLPAEVTKEEENICIQVSHSEVIQHKKFPVQKLTSHTTKQQQHNLLSDNEKLKSRLQLKTPVEAMKRDKLMEVNSYSTKGMAKNNPIYINVTQPVLCTYTSDGSKSDDELRIVRAHFRGKSKVKHLDDPELSQTSAEKSSSLFDPEMPVLTPEESFNVSKIDSSIVSKVMSPHATTTENISRPVPGMQHLFQQGEHATGVTTKQSRVLHSTPKVTKCLVGENSLLQLSQPPEEESSPTVYVGSRLQMSKSCAEGTNITKTPMMLPPQQQQQQPAMIIQNQQSNVIYDPGVGVEIGSGWNASDVSSSQGNVTRLESFNLQRHLDSLVKISGNLKTPIKLQLPPGVSMPVSFGNKKVSVITKKEAESMGLIDKLPASETMHTTVIQASPAHHQTTRGISPLVSTMRNIHSPNIGQSTQQQSHYQPNQPQQYIGSATSSQQQPSTSKGLLHQIYTKHQVQSGQMQVLRVQERERRDSSSSIKSPSRTHRYRKRPAPESSDSDDEIPEFLTDKSETTAEVKQHIDDLKASVIQARKDRRAHGVATTSSPDKDLSKRDENILTILAKYRAQNKSGASPSGDNLPQADGQGDSEAEDARNMHLCLNIGGLERKNYVLSTESEIAESYLNNETLVRETIPLRDENLKSHIAGFLPQTDGASDAKKRKTADKSTADLDTKQKKDSSATSGKKSTKVSPQSSGRTTPKLPARVSPSTVSTSKGSSSSSLSSSRRSPVLSKELSRLSPVPFVGAASTRSSPRLSQPQTKRGERALRRASPITVIPQGSLHAKRFSKKDEQKEKTFKEEDGSSFKAVKESDEKEIRKDADVFEDVSGVKKSLFADLEQIEMEKIEATTLSEKESRGFEKTIHSDESAISSHKEVLNPEPLTLLSSAALQGNAEEKSQDLTQSKSNQERREVCDLGGNTTDNMEISEGGSREPSENALDKTSPDNNMNEDQAQEDKAETVIVSEPAQDKSQEDEMVNNSALPNTECMDLVVESEKTSNELPTVMESALKTDVTEVIPLRRSIRRRSSEDISEDMPTAQEAETCNTLAEKLAEKLVRRVRNSRRISPIPPPTGTYVRVRVIARPWKTPEGTVNRPVLRMMIEGVLMLTMNSPGITMKSLYNKYSPILQPIAVIELVQMLVELGCLSRQALNPTRMSVSLFSNRRGFEEKLDSVSDDHVMLIPTIDCILKMGQFEQQITDCK